MQKSLNQMNLQLHHVISELAGMTGLAIVDAILAGERDGYKLAALRDARIRASEETIVKSLVGEYRPEHLFTLRQALEAYRFCQQQLAACDDQIRRMLQEMDSFEGGDGGSPAPWANEAFNLKSELHRVLGVDLTQIPGVEVKTAQVILSEVGVNVAKSFRSGGAFASWMGLCPDNRVTGGKVRSAHTRKVDNRVAHALRTAARSLHHSDSALGVHYRRMRAKLGAPKAIVATAHKLARIICHMLTRREAYDPSVFDEMENQRVKYVKAKLQAQARALGMRLVPAEAAC
jgi:transposase